MINLDQWEKAIAFAPHVSLDYWKSLMQQYTEILKNSNNEEYIIYQLATNDIAPLVKSRVECEEYADAKLIELLAGAGIFTDPIVNQKCLVPVVDVKEKAVNARVDESVIEELKEIGYKEAEKFFLAGEPILSACSCLAVGDFDGTIRQLIRANELFLALAICKVLNSKRIDEVQQLLGMRAERLGFLEYAEELYSKCSNKAEKLKLFAIRNKLDHKISTDSADKITNLIAANKLEEAVTTFCEHITGVFGNKDYNKLPETLRLISILQNIDIFNINMK